MTKLFSQLVRPLVALLVFQVAATASAALTMLPESSHYAGGISYFSQLVDSDEVVKGRVEYAVYDTVAYPNEFTNLGGLPGSGRFVYAYQVFVDTDNAPNLTNVAMEYFSVKGFGEGAAQVSVIGYDDPSSGTGEEPTNEYLTATKGVWEFAQGVNPGENSVLLLIRSGRDYKAGTYHVTLPETDDDIVVPGGEIPEPATLLMLSAGAALFLRVRRQG